MVVHAEQERVRLLLKEAIPLLCKNGLTYSKEFCIEALVGITLDQNDVFLVSIKETVRGDIEVSTEHLGANSEQVLNEETVVQHHSKEHSSKSKTHRKRSRPSTDRSSKDQGHTESDNDHGGTLEDTEEVIPMKRERLSGSYEDEKFFHRRESLKEQNSRRQSVKCSNSDNEDSDELVVIKCEPPVMGEYNDMSSYSGNASTFDNSTGEQVYTNYPGTSNVSSPGFVVSNISHVPGGDAAEGTSEQGPMIMPVSFSSMNTTNRDKVMDILNTSTPEKYDCERPTCSLCFKSFSSMASLRYHHTAKHLQKLSFECKSCGAKYRYRSSLQKHKRACKALNEEKAKTNV